MDKSIKKVIVLGSGALKIGEAGEFDYSGSQALKALKEEGVKTVLINPNIATIQTSENIADKVYFLPVTPEFVEQVMAKEKPDGILLAFGGQTALNCGIQLHKKNIFEKYNVRVLGTPIQAIIDTEDRDIFAEKLREIDVNTPQSIATYNVEEAKKAAKKLGYPIILRAAYALGGLGSGFCNNEKELVKTATNAFSYSDQVLVEESIKGWKEVEYEVVRDASDNCITVCNMENFDPLGIHTGESIVVAPSQTLSNKEYHMLREISIKIIRHIGVIGECNVQYALDPNSENYKVIEVNARLSRSSALASKATGYPLAFVAAKLSLGFDLHELKNSITKTTSAFFEPALDYIVCKIPRWDLNKFQGVSKQIGSSMKSVGEVMSIGRNFEEVIQKGLRMIGQGMHGFVGNNNITFDDIDKELAEPTDSRIFAIADAFEKGYSVDKIHELTKIDKWFLMKLNNIIEIKNNLNSYENVNHVPDDLILLAKQSGFTDFQIARYVMRSDADKIHQDLVKVRNHRKSKGIVPCVKQIDTLAAEYPAKTNYLYITYNGTENDVGFSKAKKTYIVLGSGAYRIGSSVEFDWCSVNAINTIRENGHNSVMINYNPETVSTDYDSCDRLYFEELSFERVMDIIDIECPEGVILSMGGQIPNNLAVRLKGEKVNILGTGADSVDRAENRMKFSSLLDKLNIDQPRWKELTKVQDIYKFTEEVGFPVIVRPSYVLSGAAMNIVSNKSELKHFLSLAKKISKQYPVVVSEFIQNAKEIELDAIANKGEIIASAISEHVEFAGVHSGDATIVIPPQKVYFETLRKINIVAKKIAAALNITGPFNIQFLAKDNYVSVIECNLRASRSFPFVSKVLKVNFIDIAVKAMLDLKIDKNYNSILDIDHVGVKAPQFSFSRLLKADPVIGVDMASTGEVGCIGEDFYEALLKAMLAVGYSVPKKNILLSTGPIEDKAALLESIKMLSEKGYKLFATKGTADFLKRNGVKATQLSWPDEDKKPNTLEYLKNKKIDLVVNIPKNLSAGELHNDYLIRRSAIDYNIPLITNSRLAKDFINSFCKVELDDKHIKSWCEYK